MPTFSFTKHKVFVKSAGATNKPKLQKTLKSRALRMLREKVSFTVLPKQNLDTSTKNSSDFQDKIRVFKSIEKRRITTNVKKNYKKRVKNLSSKQNF